MAKQAILDVLEKTIGKYVKNLDAQSLNVAVWKGQIKLNSLELNLDAINQELARQAAESPNLAIPFRVIDGSFGSLQVDVPWSHIMSQPVVMRAQGLKVVVEPFDTASSADILVDRELSEQKRLQKIHEQRTQTISSANDYREQANALRKLADEELPESITEGDQQQKATFTENLVRRIIENIQLDVTDVHISLKSSASSAGVVLQSFSVFTTNKDGQRQFVDRTRGTESFLFKVLQITGLGVYLDEFTGVSKPKMSSDEFDSIIQHSYILAPLSFEAKLRQADSKKCVDFPKYLVQSELQQMTMLLSRTQLELGNKIAAAIAPSGNASHPLFPEYRPLTRVTKDSAKCWWKYAYRCVNRLRGQGLWEDFYYAFKQRKIYILLYKRFAHTNDCPWLTPLSDKEKSQLESIEQDRMISVEGIMAWRNIADAQVEREQKKHDEAQKKKTEHKGGIMSALFGSGSKATTEGDDIVKEDDPPITLSVEEMQELEAISLQQTEDAELSNDSKLCDLSFVLGSFKCGLEGHGSKQIATFEMGTATASFKANADGSFVFDSKLESMDVYDKVTLKTLFPNVMQNIVSADDTKTKDNGVFRFGLDKSRTGDQNVTLYMAAFEIVASQMLVMEVKRFFNLSASSTHKGKYQNAILQQSLSGTVDLFYDAHQEGGESMPAFDFTEGTAAAKDKLSENITSALVDAWKSKTKEKTAWTVDCDIHAPILVIPESCSSPDANVLVFDFGRFKFEYGKNHVAPRVEKWFDEQPHPESEDRVIDPGSIAIKEMTFTIGRAGNFHWRQSVSLSAMENKMSEMTVIEPLSGTLNFGILSVVNRDIPTICAHGSVPVVGLAISPSQITKVLSVYAGWKPAVSELTGQDASGKKDKDDPVGGVQIIEGGSDHDASLHEEDLTPSPIKRLSQVRSSYVFHSARTGLSAVASRTAIEDALITLHVSMSLTRLSIRVSSDTGDGIEAHLISVAASMSQKSDGSSSSRLCMGWFWLLDRFKYDFPRRQRLIAHSTLPRSADQYAKEDKYDVLHSLPLSAFDPNYSGNTDLADITFTSKETDSSLFPGTNPFSAKDPLDRNSVSADSILDAQFSSLYLHWNPQAVKVITQAFSNTVATLQDFAEKEQLPHSSIGKVHSSEFLGDSMKSPQEHDEVALMKRTSMFISAKMKEFEITLDSAKDDMPLFNLTMSDTIMNMLTSRIEDESSTLVSLELGDIRIATPETSRIDPSYRTLLGIAPGQTESLLSVNFSMGEEAVHACGIEQVDLSKCDMCGEITLSPMRLVYIQAQVLTLVEYITQGILGALTAQAASSAAGAAVDIAQSSKGDQYFVVKATGFNVVIPQSASSTDSLKVEAGDLTVNYRGGASGGKANLSLSDVSMMGSQNEKMVNRPMRMTVAIILPPSDIGTIDDRAMRITINFFHAEFLLTRFQYQGIMLILAENIGEADPMLRSMPDDDDFMVDTELSPTETTKGEETDGTSKGLTHGGAEAVDAQSRMYIDFNLDVLSLELCGDTTSDPIAHFAAVESHIEMQMLSDKETMLVNASLQDLTCDDKRLKATGRPFRSLMSQEENEEDEGKTVGRDLFYASYKKVGASSMEVDLKLGSPRIVFIPDVVSEILHFFQTPKTVPLGEKEPTPPPVITSEESRELPEDGEQVVHVHVDEKEESIETAFVSMAHGSDSQSVTKMSVSIKTANCSVVLIDMGTTELSSESKSKSVSQVTETIVLQGQFDAQTSLSSETESGRLVSARGELHGECMEVYTAHGNTFSTPVQIFEPASISAFVSLSPTGDQSKTLDIRFVTLSAIECTFSTQNAALLNAIVSSWSNYSNSNQMDETNDTAIVPLNEQEASNVEALSSALQTPNALNYDDSSVHTERSVADQSNVSRNESDVMSLVTRVQVTMTETKLTLINDLQGMDEALFRINASNFVAGAEITQGLVTSSGALKGTIFNIQVHTSFKADYFDSSVQLWKVLLKKPWEVTLKSSREAGRRSSDRMASTVDIEAQPCLISFSEQFVVSLSAASKMWSIYSIATTNVVENKARDSDRKGEVGASKKALAASAARCLVASLPYAVENHSGADIYLLVPSSGERRTCTSGTIQYFRFEPPQGTGTGGQRRYGQDITTKKSVSFFVQGKTIELEDIDAEFSRPRQAHLLGNGQYLISSASKDGKTKTIHLSSPLDVHNCSSVAFALSVFIGGQDRAIGVCGGHQGDLSILDSSRLSFNERDGSTCKASKRFGVPIDLLSQDNKTTTLRIIPQVDGDSVTGEVVIPPLQEIVAHAQNGEATSRLDVMCKSPRETHQTKAGTRLPDPFSLQIRLKAKLVDRNYPYIEMFIEPRLVLENNMPIPITVRTPMPHTFKAKEKLEAGKVYGDLKGYETYHELAQSEVVEVFTPGPSLAIGVKCSDPPVGGTSTDWMEGGWVDIPLVREFGLSEPIPCLFPFVRRTGADQHGIDGSEFFIVEAGNDLNKYLQKNDVSGKNAEISAYEEEDSPLELVEPKAPTRKVLITVCNYGVDHTGDVLFEAVSNQEGRRKSKAASVHSSFRRSSSVAMNPCPYSAFASLSRRITLLPHYKSPLRLLHLTMEGEEGVRRSKPFYLDDISICEGGIESTPLNWEDDSESGFYAYRRLVDAYQFEVHVIPEFIVFNGSKTYRVLVKQQGGPGKVVEPGRVAPVRSTPKLGLVLSVDFIDLQASTAAMTVDVLGLRVAVVRTRDGSPLGSLAVQTVIGNHDSKLAVKLGELKFGSGVDKDDVRSPSQGMFENDTVRFRIRWSEFQLTLNEARTMDSDDSTGITSSQSALDRLIEAQSPIHIRAKASPRQKSFSEAKREQMLEEQSEIERRTQSPVCTIVLQRFTVDWQRIFKDGQATTNTGDRSARDLLLSPERSQFSVIVHNVRLLDETPNSKFPVVFDSTSSTTSFFDLCLRFRGPLQTELVKVDLVDLNLAHSRGKTEKIIIQTSEDFVWKAIDVANRIAVSTAQLAGVDLKMEWDEEHQEYLVSIEDSTTKSPGYFDTEESYTPPSSDTLYDISKARVSPFDIQVSFVRRPQTSRYKHLNDVRGAKLMNYFTRKLKFKVDRATLKFSKYETSNVKGPPDQLIQLLIAVYSQRMKYKVVSMLSAVSFDDWKNLAARDSGNDEFQDGDLLRVTGNLAGGTAGYFAKQVGGGIGTGIHTVTRVLGKEIEDATDKVGARAVGAGVNCVVTGLGAGVGDTVTGVGSGTGKLLQGAGKGVGQVFGGVTGGATLMAKGIGKGVMQGDGKAVISGISKGAQSVGNGVGQGIESAVMGAADGVITCGEGLASGVKSIGQGFASAFTGDACCSCWGESNGQNEDN